MIPASACILRCCLSRLYSTNVMVAAMETVHYNAVVRVYRGRPRTVSPTHGMGIVESKTPPDGGVRDFAAKGLDAGERHVLSAQLAVLHLAEDGSHMVGGNINEGNFLLDVNRADDFTGNVG